MAQSLVVMVGGAVLVAILLRILIVVRRQTNRLKELETRMKATEDMEVTDNNG
ncbi:MAG TPA: hypothetical protein PK096_01580 [Candidatus Saccharibacteria bacterium]|nr:hypothetical protein [Candidatus Saccharibacteria bacterium]HRK94037.1 hypothetical protein [Candidatus Saccharibacteria bacterium]